MIIFASEDVGMADPQSLLVAVAASQALDHVGLPEAQLNLSQAAIHLAAAPKSNRAALAIWNARADVQAGGVGEVPPHLRDAHYQGAKVLGHGVGYEYPHDHPQGWVAQQYLPTEQIDKRYYDPTVHGNEARVAQRMDERTAPPSGPESGRRDTQ
jgi:putative ATPase